MVDVYAFQAIPGDDIPLSIVVDSVGVCTDEVAVGLKMSVYARTPVTEARPAGDIRADEVPRDPVVHGVDSRVGRVSEDFDSVLGVARDQVSRSGVASADYVVRRAALKQDSGGAF